MRRLLSFDEAIASAALALMTLIPLVEIALRPLQAATETGDLVVRLLHQLVTLDHLGATGAGQGIGQAHVAQGLIDHPDQFVAQIAADLQTIADQAQRVVKRRGRSVRRCGLG